MSTEAAALIKILRDVTQSKAVFDRCDAELKRLGSQPNWGAHNKQVETLSALSDDYRARLARDYFADLYRSLGPVVDRTLPAKSGTPS